MKLWAYIIIWPKIIQSKLAYKCYMYIKLLTSLTIYNLSKFDSLMVKSTLPFKNAENNH